MGPRLGHLDLSITIGLVSPALADETVRVTADKLKFERCQVAARVDDTIEWASSDFVGHTATVRNRDWDVAMPAKGVGRVTRRHAGDVDYFCRFHPNMMGRIWVAP